MTENNQQNHQQNSELNHNSKTTLDNIEIPFGKPISETLFKERVLCDYTTKYSYMMYNDMTAKDFNTLLMIFNYCFYTKNSFFLPSFNTFTLTLLYKMYNRIKTNILNTLQYDIFNGVDEKSLKCFKYIISNILANDKVIIENNKLLFEYIDINSIKTIHKFMTYYIDNSQNRQQ